MQDGDTGLTGRWLDVVCRPGDGGKPPIGPDVGDLIGMSLHDYSDTVFE